MRGLWDRGIGEVEAVPGYGTAALVAHQILGPIVVPAAGPVPVWAERGQGWTQARPFSRTREGIPNVETKDLTLKAPSHNLNDSFRADGLAIVAGSALASGGALLLPHSDMIEVPVEADDEEVTAAFSQAAEQAVEEEETVYVQLE